MAIRIKKEIGYFLDESLIDKIIDRKKFDALDFYDLPDDILIRFIDFANQFYSEKESVEKQLFQMDYNLDRLLSNKIEIQHLINRLFFNINDLKGVFFKTPSLHFLSRNNNSIDFYENNQKIEDKIVKVNEPLYPDTYYVCTEKIQLNNQTFNIGDKFFPSYFIPESIKKKMMIGVPYELYLLANFLGILKKDVDYANFCSYVQPAIATYWR